MRVGKDQKSNVRNIVVTIFVFGKILAFKFYYYPKFCCFLFLLSIYLSKTKMKISIKLKKNFKILHKKF